MAEEVPPSGAIGSVKDSSARTQGVIQEGMGGTSVKGLGVEKTSSGQGPGDEVLVHRVVLQDLGTCKGRFRGLWSCR